MRTHPRWRIDPVRIRRFPGTGTPRSGEESGDEWIISPSARRRPDTGCILLSLLQCCYARTDTGRAHAVEQQVRTTIRGESVLAARLRAPRLPLHLVRRPHLAAQLQQALERPLTLVAAPAGFGKTTLLASWLA